MGRTVYRTKLSDLEWNSIQDLTRNTHLDKGFDVWQHRNGEDCFKDFEDNRLKPLRWGLKLLYESIAYPLKHENLTKEQSNALVELFKEFKIGNEDWYAWLLSEDA